MVRPKPGERGEKWWSQGWSKNALVKVGLEKDNLWYLVQVVTYVNATSSFNNDTYKGLKTLTEKNDQIFI